VSLSDPDCFSDELMAFVISCLFCGAISKKELNVWSAQALSWSNSPAFLYDLMEFHGEIFKVYEIVGYVPTWEHSESDEYALYGIAVRRGEEPYDMPLAPSEALAYLEASPDIERLFCRAFEFIKI